MRGGGLNPHKDGEALWDLVFNQREAILATLKRDGRPQLSNVLYVVDPDSRTVRISTTSERAKARNLGRDPRAALHVSGDNFWSYAVAEGQATLSPVARTAGDDACEELFAVHSAFYETLQPEAFYEEMIANRRLVVRIRLERVYGIISTSGRRPQKRSDDAGADDADK
jgi:PPOX class probable F420-dependent enzyme